MCCRWWLNRVVRCGACWLFVACGVMLAGQHQEAHLVVWHVGAAFIRVHGRAIAVGNHNAPSWLLLGAIFAPVPVLAVRWLPMACFWPAGPVAARFCVRADMFCVSLTSRMRFGAGVFLDRYTKFVLHFDTVGVIQKRNANLNNKRTETRTYFIRSLF